MTTGYGGEGTWKFWIFLIAVILLIAFGMLLNAYFSIVPADQTDALTVPPTVAPDPQERKNEALEEQRRLRRAEEMAKAEADIVYWLGIMLIIVIGLSVLVLVFALAVRIVRQPDPGLRSPPPATPGGSGDGASAAGHARQDAPPQQQAPAEANGSGQAAPLYTAADTVQDRPAAAPESEPRLVLRRIETRPASGSRASKRETLGFQA